MPEMICHRLHAFLSLWSKATAPHLTLSTSIFQTWLKKIVPFKSVSFEFQKRWTVGWKETMIFILCASIWEATGGYKGDSTTLSSFLLLQRQGLRKQAILENSTEDCNQHLTPRMEAQARSVLPLNLWTSEHTPSLSRNTLLFTWAP